MLEIVGDEMKVEVVGFEVGEVLDMVFVLDIVVGLVEVELNEVGIGLVVVEVEVVFEMIVVEV